TFAPPRDFDLEKFRTQRLYFGNGHLSAEVRFPPALASQLRERFAAIDIVRDDKEGVQVRVATSSTAWLARWVLSFGADAEVMQPPACREYLHALCKDAAEAYAKPVADDALKGPATTLQATAG